MSMTSCSLHRISGRHMSMSPRLSRYPSHSGSVARDADSTARIPTAMTACKPVAAMCSNIQVCSGRTFRSSVQNRAVRPGNICLWRINSTMVRSPATRWIGPTASVRGPSMYAYVSGCSHPVSANTRSCSMPISCRYRLNAVESFPPLIEATTMEPSGTLIVSPTARAGRTLRRRGCPTPLADHRTSPESPPRQRQEPASQQA